MRKRLTARNVRAESQADGLFPGDIGNMERSKNYHDPSEYSNYDWQAGWDVPDPNAPKINDERDEIGFGIPKTADVYQTAKAAAILAQMYLGDEAPEEAIEDQARDFMKLGHRRILASIRRWKATEPAPEEKTEDPADNTPAGEEAEACKKGSDEENEAEKTGCGDATPEENLKAGDETDPNTDEVPAEDLEEVVSGEEEAPEMNLEMPEVSEDTNAAPVFSGSEDLNQAQPDPELEALFDGEEVEEKPETPVAKKASKKGLKHLGGQPKLASTDSYGVKELEGIWTNLRAPGL